MTEFLVLCEKQSNSSSKSLFGGIFMIQCQSASFLGVIQGDASIFFLLSWKQKTLEKLIVVRPLTG